MFSLRYYRRLIGNLRVLGHDDAGFVVEASYAVYATDVVDGTTEIFSAGKYRDKIVTAADGGLRFKEKVVIAHTSSIPKNLSVPL